QGIGHDRLNDRRANLNGYTDSSAVYHPGILELSSVTAAGAHPDATTHISLRTKGGNPNQGDPAEDPRDVLLELPAGFLGNPEVVPACPRRLFEAFDPRPASAGPDGGNETCPPA